MILLANLFLVAPLTLSLFLPELEEQFRIVDLNKDGFIDATELRTVMDNLGVKSTEEEIKIILEQADHNGMLFQWEYNTGSIGN